MEHRSKYCLMPMIISITNDSYWSWIGLKLQVSLDSEAILIS